MIKIDTHFHTNFSLFSEKLTKKRAQKIWDKFDQIGLDYVIISEHVFRKPKKQYFSLKKYKQEKNKTVLIPGVEALTKEGIDIIVFSESENIFSYKEIFTPKYFTLKELIDFVNSKKDLYCIVTHPYNTSDTAVIWHYNKDELKNFVTKSGFIEKYNACWYSLQLFFEKYGLNKVFKGLHKRISYNGNVPKDNYFENTIIMGGSDAHHPEYLGDYLELDTDIKKFASIINPKIKRNFVYSKNRKNLLWYLIKNGITVSIEGLQKRLKLYKLYNNYE